MCRILVFQNANIACSHGFYGWEKSDALHWPSRRRGGEPPGVQHANSLRFLAVQPHVYFSEILFVHGGIPRVNTFWKKWKSNSSWLTFLAWYCWETVRFFFFFWSPWGGDRCKHILQSRCYYCAVCWLAPIRSRRASDLLGSLCKLYLMEMLKSGSYWSNKRLCVYQ